MNSLPNIIEHRFDNYTVFQYLKTNVDKDTYMVYTQQNGVYLFEIGQVIGIIGKLTEYTKWLWNKLLALKKKSSWF